MNTNDDGSTNLSDDSGGDGNTNLNISFPIRRRKTESILQFAQRKAAILEKIKAKTEEDLKKVYSHILKDIETFCSSDSLTLDLLKEKLKYVTDLAMIGSRSLLHACGCQNVRIEIVEYLLDFHLANMWQNGFPENGGTSLVFPLHVACHNESCSSPIIELLIEKSESKVFEHESLIGGRDLISTEILADVHGLPLNHYLSRGSSHIDIKVVRKLVNAYQDALTTPLRNMRLNSAPFVTPLTVLMLHDDINQPILLDVFRLLAESSPDSVQMVNSNGTSLLHISLAHGKNINPEIIRIILEVWPEGSRHRFKGILPVHILCENMNFNEDDSLEVLRLLIDSFPESLREIHGNDYPLHRAAAYGKSPAFCKLIIQSDPESLFMLSPSGKSPLHRACTYFGTLDTIEYFDSLDRFGSSLFSRWSGYLPIQLVLLCHQHRGRSEGYKIIKYFLERDPSSAYWIRDNEDRLLLHLACIGDVSIEIITLIFNEYPQAVIKADQQGKIPSEYLLEGRRRSFLGTQQVYAASDEQRKETIGDDDMLPVHDALHHADCLGTIKLLLTRRALNIPDRDGLLPFHIACNVGSLDVVKYILAEGRNIFRPSESFNFMVACGEQKEYPLHVACRKGKFSVVKLLVDEQSASVSKTRYDGKLPIHLLCEAEDGVVDRESVEYVESIFLLLKAQPEAALDFRNE